MNLEKRKIALSLFLLRMGVALVMGVWTLDKFVNPEHAARVFEKFYLFEGLDFKTAYILGTLQALVVIAFALGIKKKFSYGLILLMHAVSTFSSYAKYLDPWNSLLFFAAWPMLAACVALYLLRDLDAYSLEKK